MPEEPLEHSAELSRAFADYERVVRIQNYKVGCALGIVFMPAGASLDYFVYPGHLAHFWNLRLWCSLLLACVWGLLNTRLGARLYRPLGLIEVSLPLLFISGMIYLTEGPNSPYYAGLNLVVMGAGIVLRWSLLDSIVVVLLALGMYTIACLAYGPITAGNHAIFFNNVYFLAVTGVFIITGNYFLNKIRFSEFTLRHELDRNRHILEEANRRLVELDQVKSRFFANISHELRTPLTLLLAPLEALLHQRGPGFDEQTRDWLRTMHTNGMRLLKLINDLLDLVRLESGKMQVKREAVAVNEFILGLVHSIRKVADDKRVRLDGHVTGCDHPMHLDRDKLERVVLNLLFNAIKFTPAGGQVDVRAERQGRDLVVQVIDTGMGISPEHLPRIFDRFWQADTSSRRKYQGTGIGLALVKELVEAQGGQVSVNSQLGKGTTMTIRIPCPEDAAAEPAEPVPPPAAPAVATVTATPGPDTQLNEWLAGLYRRAELFPSLTPLQESLRPVENHDGAKRPRVLVADDEPDMLRFLKSQLDPHFQVLEAVDGQQAVEKAAQFLPDLVLCDMMMPEKDGLQVCRELRSRIGTQNIPVVMLTARADDETKLAALAAGASDFLVKPFSTTELHVRLKNLFENHQLQRKLARQNQILEATIEQLKETETQLVQTEKLASLGRMSAGIIHEINNPLNYAKTGLYTLKGLGGDLPGEARAQYEDILHDVEEGIDRVKTIVSDLRTFTHPSADQFDFVEVAPVVDAALRFLSNELKDGIQVEKQIPPGLTVWANYSKLVQVLVNLLQNSVDALAEKAPAGETPRIRITGATVPGKVQLVVWDNGPGISEENRQRIFDPFFTTKDVGAGMGLGLSICYRIMEAHEGRIQVRSEPGQSCEFTLEFPQKV